MNTQREAKQIAWQNFGTDVSNAASIEEAIEMAQLNYKVETEPIIRVPQEIVDAILNNEQVDFTPTKEMIINSHKATFRTDFGNNFGVVGKDYGVVQNNKAFDFINFIKEVSGEQPKLETAGSLGFGERMFVTCRLGADSYLNGDSDAIRNYVVFCNNHDGKGAVMAFFSPIRVICQNTLNMAIKQCPNKIVFKHTKHVNVRMDWEIEENRKKALEVFSKSVQFSKAFMDNMLNLKQQKLDAEQIRDLTAKMYLSPKLFTLFSENNFNLEGIDEITTRTKNQIQQLRDSIDFGVGQDQHRGTKLWMLNGITTMLHNDKNWKSAQDEFNSIMEGDAAKKVQKMYDLLLAA